MYLTEWFGRLSEIIYIFIMSCVWSQQWPLCVISVVYEKHGSPEILESQLVNSEIT